MTDLGSILVASFVAFTGPDGQRIDVQTSQITSVREPRSVEHFAPGVKCILHMTDGKFVTVIEPCETVRERIGDVENRE